MHRLGEQSMGERRVRSTDRSQQRKDSGAYSTRPHAPSIDRSNSLIHFAQQNSAAASSTACRQPGRLMDTVFHLIVNLLGPALRPALAPDAAPRRYTAAANGACLLGLSRLISHSPTKQRVAQSAPSRVRFASFRLCAPHCASLLATASSHRSSVAQRSTLGEQSTLQHRLAHHCTRHQQRTPPAANHHCAARQ